MGDIFDQLATLPQNGPKGDIFDQLAPLFKATPNPVMPRGAIPAITPNGMAPAMPPVPDAIKQQLGLGNGYPVPRAVTGALAKVADVDPIGLLKGFAAMNPASQAYQTYQDFKKYGIAGPPADERVRRGAALLGINADDVAEMARNKDYQGLLGEGLGAVANLYLTKKLTEGATKLGGAAYNKVQTSPEIQARNLAGALPKSSGDIYADIAKPVIADAQQVAKGLNLKSSDFVGDRGGAALSQVAETGIKQIEQQYQPMLARAINKVVLNPSVKQAIQSRITPALEVLKPEVAARLRDFAIRVDKPFTVGELNGLRVLGNEILSDYYKRGINEQATSGVELKALRDLTNTVRDVTYGEVERANGLPPDTLAPLKIREGNFIKLRGLAEQLKEQMSNLQSASQSTTALDVMRHGEFKPTVSKIVQKSPIGLDDVGLINAKLKRALLP